MKREHAIKKKEYTGKVRGDKKELNIEKEEK